MEDRSPILLGAATALLITSWITFLSRLWVRGHLLARWGTDDWLMTCSIALFTAYYISQAVGISYGTGKHIRDLEPGRAQAALVTWWLCELFYIACTVFLKLSVGVFLHRIVINRWHTWIIRVMMVCTSVFGFAFLLVGIFMCHPVESWWIRRHDVSSVDYGSCASDDAVIGLTYAGGALNSVADFTFGLLPFFIIKDLHMPAKSKRLVAGLLTFANIACIATIIRMAYIQELYNTTDWLYATVNVVVWCTVEIGVGITAACFATLRPLLRILFGIHASQWFPDQEATSGQVDRYTSTVVNGFGSSEESYRMDDAGPKLRMDRVGHITEVSSAGSRQSRGRTRERRDPGIAGRWMRDLYSKPDEEQEEKHLSMEAQVPAGVTLENGERAPFPRLEIRKDFGFSYSVKERNTDEADSFEERWRATRARWPSETTTHHARDTAASHTMPRSGDQSEEDAFDLPIQTHGLDK